MKGILNKNLGITTSNLMDTIPELKEAIDSQCHEGKTNKEILHQALKSLGWSQKEITFLELSK